MAPPSEDFHLQQHSTLFCSREAALSEARMTCHCGFCSSLCGMPTTSPRFSICSSDAGDMSPPCTAWNTNSNTPACEIFQPIFPDSYLDAPQYLDLVPLSDMESCLSHNYDPAPDSHMSPLDQATSGRLGSPRSTIGPIGTVATKNEVSCVPCSFVVPSNHYAETKGSESCGAESIPRPAAAGSE